VSIDDKLAGGLVTIG